MDSPLYTVVLALVASICFGAALVVGHVGLRHASPLTGGTISSCFTAVLWLALSPFLADLSAWHPGGLLVYALVGVFYPAAVMTLSYESNRVLGPTLTGALSSTAPLFATAAAVMVLGELLTFWIAVGGIIAVAGLVLLALRAPMRAAPGWRLALPISGAALRGIAQMLTKFGLTMWPSPFAAALISYGTSAAVMGGVWAVAPRHASRLTGAAILWFIAVGLLNGSAVLLMYHALYHGTVAVVSTIVATHPLFTLFFSALFLRSERLTVTTVVAVIMIIVGVVAVILG